MAEVVSDFPPGRSRGRKDRWDKYLDGQTWKITRGVDFAETLVYAKECLYRRAFDMDKKATTRTDRKDPDILYVKAVSR